MVSTLKYTVIKNEVQYDLYCSILEKLLQQKKKLKQIQEEIELLTLLIEKFDEERHLFHQSSVPEILHSLLAEHQLKSKELAQILGVSEGLVSDMRSGKKPISKKNIQILSKHFKINPAFLLRV